MAKHGKDEHPGSEEYHSEVDDEVGHDLKKQKMEIHNLGEVDDDAGNQEDHNIDSALLAAEDHERTSAAELHDIDARFLNGVANRIIDSVVKRGKEDEKNRNSGTSPNSDNDSRNNLGDSDSVGAGNGSYSDEDTNDQATSLKQAEAAVRAVNKSSKNGHSEAEEEVDEEEENDVTSQTYNDLISRHGLEHPDDSVSLSASVEPATESTTMDDLNDKRLLAKRGRKTTAIAGSEAWKQQRRASHKEVERRRRETINDAINSLSKLLPVKESSKAAILSRAAEYIQKLKETENANIEKWTLQKLLSEQNTQQLSSANEKLQEELANAYKEINFLKRLLKKNNVSLDSESDEE